MNSNFKSYMEQRERRRQFGDNPIGEYNRKLMSATTESALDGIVTLLNDEELLRKKAKDEKSSKEELKNKPLFSANDISFMCECFKDYYKKEFAKPQH